MADTFVNRPDSSLPPGARSIRRRWLFRLAAVALGLLPLLLLEAGLRLLNWGGVDQHVDPFVGFDGQQPLFVLNAAADRYEIARGRYLCFRPDSFAARKADNEYRVFCLGGSTVQGRPYAIETSFTTWLELSLQAADPARRFDVVNCGGISYASYRLVPILEEVLRYQPDLIILYTGHNEFLEDRTYRPIKQRRPATRWVLRQATRLRTYNLLWSRWNQWRTADSPPAAKPSLPTEVEARLDYRGGLALYHRDPAWQTAVVEHFEFNLRRMIALCRAAGVPLWIADPVCNLRGCPPFKAQHRDGLTDQQLSRWQQLRQEASERFRGDVVAATRLLEQAAGIDDQHAGLMYDLAKSYDTVGRLDDAHGAYLRAKELDVCPLRITEPLRQAIHRACRDTNTPLLDVAGLFARNGRDGIPGGYLLVDHVHPSITGHQMIAQLLMERFWDEGLVKTDAAWAQRRDQLYAQHMASLDDAYYLEGQRRLEGLRKWAAGRATPERTP